MKNYANVEALTDLLLSIGDEVGWDQQNPETVKRRVLAEALAEALADRGVLAPWILTDHDCWRAARSSSFSTDHTEMRDELMQIARGEF